MTLLYLRYRVLMAWSALKPGGSKDWGYRIVIGVACLANLPVLALMYWGMRQMFSAIVEGYGLGTLLQLLHLPAAAYAILLLFLVINRVHPSLFEATDDSLLRSLPVRPWLLAHARLTLLALSLSPLLLLFMPLAVFFGMESGAPPHYYPMAALLTAVYGLFILGLGVHITARLPAADVVDAEPADVGTASGLGWWAPSWLGPASRALMRRDSC
jgi:hypothetical protein